jgi:hypothetical protein
MSDGRPSFAFAFRSGLGEALRDLAAADVAPGNADFVWVHLDLGDAAAQAWLCRRPWPPEIVETVAAPIQRGRPDFLLWSLARSVSALSQLPEVPALNRFCSPQRRKVEFASDSSLEGDGFEISV